MKRISKEMWGFFFKKGRKQRGQKVPTEKSRKSPNKQTKRNENQLTKQKARRKTAYHGSHNYSHNANEGQRGKIYTVNNNG